MYQKITLFLLFVAVFLPFAFTHAAVEINEIMYDLPTGSDEGREWVEIYNNTDNAVDFSSFRFFEADTNHKLILFQGNSDISAREYVVIVSNPEKFKIDRPNFTGTIFDSSFSLSNSGEILVIKDEKLNIVDQYIYNSSMGGAGDGKSLQKINGVWVSASPSPGVENKLSISKPIETKTETKNLIFKKDFVVATKPSVAVATPVELEIGISAQGPEKLISDDDILKEDGDSFVFFVIFILIIFGGASVVFFIRKKDRISSKIGDDFEILD